MNNAAYNIRIDPTDVAPPSAFTENRWFAYLASGIPGNAPVQAQMQTNTGGLPSVLESNAEMNTLVRNYIVFVGVFVLGAILFVMGKR